MKKIRLILVYSLIEPLRYFMDQFKKCADERNISYYLADCANESTYTSKAFSTFCEQDNVYMFTFNGGLISLADDGGANVWKKHHIPVFSFMVDHPRNYDSILHDPPCDIHIMALDLNHIVFMERFFPKISSVTFCPDGGTIEAGAKVYTERTIDVIYMGSCQKKIQGFPKINGLPEDGMELFVFAIKYLLCNPGKTAEEAVYEYFAVNHFGISEENLYRLMVELNVSAYVEEYVRRYFKLTCMKALDDAGIRVEIYGGDSWLDDEIIFSDNIKIHPRISNQEVNRILGNAKVSLSFMPWYKRGSSEKPFDSMLNGAVCVSDRSEYLDANYHDGQNIVYFELNNPEQLAADINWLLKNPDVASRIAGEGYETAKKYDLWEHRFMVLLDSCRSYTQEDLY